MLISIDKKSSSFFRTVSFFRTKCTISNSLKNSDINRNLGFQKLIPVYLNSADQGVVFVSRWKIWVPNYMCGKFDVFCSKISNSFGCQLNNLFLRADFSFVILRYPIWNGKHSRMRPVLSGSRWRPHVNDLLLCICLLWVPKLFENTWCPKKGWECRLEINLWYFDRMWR